MSAAAAWCLLSAVARAVQQALLELDSTSGAIVNGCHTTLLLPRESARDRPASAPTGAQAKPATGDCFSLALRRESGDRIADHAIVLQS